MDPIYWLRWPLVHHQICSCAFAATGGALFYFGLINDVWQLLPHVISFSGVMLTITIFDFSFISMFSGTQRDKLLSAGIDPKSIDSILGTMKAYFVKGVLFGVLTTLLCLIILAINIAWPFAVSVALAVIGVYIFSMMFFMSIGLFVSGISMLQLMSKN